MIGVVVLQFEANNGIATVKTVGNYVYKRGKIFQCGNYPDKGVEIGIEELRAANIGFTPVPLNIEHQPSVFDGRLGELVAVEVADDGAVYGLLVVPKAVDELLVASNDETQTVPPEIPVSIEIRKADKKIVGLAFAKFPRVEDAAVFASLGIVNAPVKDPKMTWKDKLQSALSSFSAVVAEIPETETKPAPAVAPDTSSLEAQVKAEREAREKAEQALAAEREAQRVAAEKAEADAVAKASRDFAESLVKDGKIVPAQVDQVASIYSTALRADNAGKAIFTNGNANEGEQVKAVREVFSQVKANDLSDQKFKQVPGARDNQMTDAEVKNALMAQSTLGRSVLKQNQDKGKKY